MDTGKQGIGHNMKNAVQMLSGSVTSLAVPNLKQGRIQVH